MTTPNWTFTTSANSTAATFSTITYSSGSETATYTPRSLRVPEPCPDCDGGILTVDGLPYKCDACDGTGETFHMNNEE